MVFFHSPRVGCARVEACRVKLLPALCLAPVPPVPGQVSRTPRRASGFPAVFRHSRLGGGGRMAGFLSFDVINEWTVLEDSMRFAHPDFDFDALVVTGADGQVVGADGQLEDADHPPGRVLGGRGSENDMMVSCMAFDRRAWRGSGAERFFLLAQAAGGAARFGFRDSLRFGLVSAVPYAPLRWQDENALSAEEDEDGEAEDPQPTGGGPDWYWGWQVCPTFCCSHVRATP
jgi:hypothetical protein